MVIRHHLVLLLLLHLNKGASSGETSSQAVLLLSDQRSGSTFIGALLNRDPRVSYYYEPCASLLLLNQAEVGHPHLLARRARGCEDLVLRLLSCNATEGDLFGLLRDGPSVKHDTAFLRVAKRTGALLASPDDDSPRQRRQQQQQQQQQQQRSPANRASIGKVTRTLRSMQDLPEAWRAECKVTPIPNPSMKFDPS